MGNMEFGESAEIVQEINKICEPFLNPRGLAYFQFKRVYKDNSFIILANRLEFARNFLEKDLSEFFDQLPFCTRQSVAYYWDDTTHSIPLSRPEGKKKVYHAITFISRRKNFGDCVTFARSEAHPLPFSYYFCILKELQKFVEIFPILAQHLIEKSKDKRKENVVLAGTVKRKNLFLPSRSARFRIGEGAKDYITTYEAFCLQLLEEGKSYKEIGSILSMSPNTVETHLTRLKTRTGLTFQELSLQSLQTFHGKKKNGHVSAWEESLNPILKKTGK